MKSMITITVDHELKEKLKQESNASDLINRLLIAHYKLKDTPQSPIDEYKALTEAKQALEAKQAALSPQVKAMIAKQEMQEAEERREMLSKDKQYSIKWTKELNDEYQDGLKKGLWKNTLEFTRKKFNIS